METKEKIIQLTDVSKVFNGADAVKDLTFFVPKGTIFGFIGPSGSGKTTTIRMLTGYYRPSHGEVRVFGHSPELFSRADQERIGYLPQLFNLYPNLTVWENLSFSASIYGLPLARHDRLMRILEFVELDHARKKLASQLSGGMLRRLNLAATLVHEPELVFLDEPTAGVDPILRRKFWDHFRTLKEQGRTLFITTQYVSEAAYCDLVGVIDEGRLAALDTPSMLRYRAFGGDLVNLHTAKSLDLDSQRDIKALPFVLAKIQQLDDLSIRLVVKEAKTAMPALMDWASKRNLQIDEIDEYLPPFDDVFVELLKKEVEDA